MLSRQVLVCGSGMDMIYIPLPHDNLICTCIWEVELWQWKLFSLNSPCPHVNCKLLNLDLIFGQVFSSPTLLNLWYINIHVALYTYTTRIFSCRLTPAVSKVSTGVLELVPVYKVHNKLIFLQVRTNKSCAPYICVTPFACLKTIIEDMQMVSHLFTNSNSTQELVGTFTCFSSGFPDDVTKTTVLPCYYGVYKPCT